MGEYITKPVCKILMLKGEKGDRIASVKKTSSSVLTDTYTITITNGDQYKFEIKNGKGISKIEKTGTNVLADTYTILFNDGTAETFNITNGNGIKSIAKTATSGLTDTYTITYDNGTTQSFNVTNGKSVPAGGTTGQFLRKKSNTDYECEWATFETITNSQIDAICK